MFWLSPLYKQIHEDIILNTSSYYKALLWMLQEEGTCQSFSGSQVLHKATIKVSRAIHLPPPCIGKMGSGRG